MRKHFIVCITCLFCLRLAAQDNAAIKRDSIPALDEVKIKGYENNRKLLDMPSSVSVLTPAALQQVTSVTLLPAMNAVPGVRMEERSPGSYRLSLRGSLLRSPFGVRNVKVYWNDIPFTDAGGNTYINLVDLNALEEVEILKGPPGSVYGAGTGGAVLLHALPPAEPIPFRGNKFQVGLTGGSYDLLAENAKWNYQGNNFTSILEQSHQQATGYRVHSRLRRDNIQWNGRTQLSKKDELSWIALYSNIYYQTPGGLTLAQQEADPRQARPSTAVIPGPEVQKAAVYNKTGLGGLTNTFHINSAWQNISSLVFAYTDFRNPFLTNYEMRKETSFGVRTKFMYDGKLGNLPMQFVAGGEWQNTFSKIDNYGNDKGVADTIQTRDEVGATQQFYFAQVSLNLTQRLIAEMGASVNLFQYNYQRLSDNPSPKNTKKFDAQVLPRFALLYKITKTTSVHAAVSKGFSAPTIAEVRPSQGNFFTDLQPEFGWNYEVGIRGTALQYRLSFDLNLYQFKLQQAIVRRVDSSGAEYFVNSGGTNQKGIEAQLGYWFIHNVDHFFRGLRVWTSFTINDYKFSDYKVASADYSGNEITGVPKNVIVSGLDIETAPRLYLNVSYNYTSRLPLNDANSVYAQDYRLLQGRVGWKRNFRTVQLEIFAGIDNGLNQLYSLGNDINAVGNRYYNPAPARNYFGGIVLGFGK